MSYTIGGGAGGGADVTGSGGAGGFGGGRGSGAGGRCTFPFVPGPSGGNGGFGGGGGVLGGGIRILNSTFTGNSVYRGNSGGGEADNDAGGAILYLNGHTTINNATISGNHITGSQGGIVVMQDSSSSDTIFVLENTIISGNGPKQCSIVGSSIGESFAGNLIKQNDNCLGVVTSLDPQLGPLQKQPRPRSHHGHSKEQPGQQCG